jgi:hypothetical protein
MNFNSTPCMGTNGASEANNKGSKLDENLDRLLWSDCPEEEYVKKILHEDAGSLTIADENVPTDVDTGRIIVQYGNQEDCNSEAVIQAVHTISQIEGTGRSGYEGQPLDFGRESVTEEKHEPLSTEVRVVGNSSVWSGRSIVCDQGLSSDAEVTLDEMHKEFDQEEELVLRDILHEQAEHTISASPVRNPAGKSPLAKALYGSNEARSSNESIAGQDTIAEIVMDLENGELIDPAEDGTYRSWTDFNPIACSVASGPTPNLSRRSTQQRFVNDDSSVGSWTEDIQVIIKERLEVTDDTGTVANQNTFVSSLSNDTFGRQPKNRTNQPAQPEPLPWWIVAETAPFEESGHSSANSKNTQSQQNGLPQGDEQRTPIIAFISTRGNGDLEASSPGRKDEASKHELATSSKQGFLGFLRRSVKENAAVRQLLLLSAVFLAAFIALGVVILIQSRNEDVP